MGKLIEEEEDEADNDFYKQSFWEEAEEDDEYDMAADADAEDGADSFDSDFGDSTESDDDEDDEKAEKAANRREKVARKKSVYVDPKAKAKEGGEGGAAPKPKASKKRKASELGEGGVSSQNIQRGSLRASTQDATSLAAEKRRQATERSELRAARQLANAGKKGVELRRLTQEDILLEAKQTEIINRASLEKMMRLEEEKRKVIVRDRSHSGPRVVSRTYREGDSVRNSLTFNTDIPETIDAVAPSYPVPARCTVTNLPAKYFDPLTGCPYATLEAFRMLRGKTGRRNPFTAPGEGAAGSAQAM